jgi:hypothetical protein
MLRFHDTRIAYALLEKKLNAFYNAHQQKKLRFGDSNPPFFIETIECLELDIRIYWLEALFIGSTLHNRKGIAYEDHQ